MSGGVDSSVAAAKMLEEGYEVIGLTMRVWSDSQYETAPKEGRTPHDDADEAERVARHLGIPHFELNVKETFREEVVRYFINEYQRGCTPNPCIVCNHRIKFGVLLEKALSLGAEKMATGHYARSGWEPDRRRYYLKKGMDSDRDQSYMLFRLNQEQLAKSIFPLGDSSKEIIRAKALQLGLNMDEKKESQEICFIPGDDYREFLRRQVGTFPPGPIIDTGGNHLGEHRGLPFYTIGQRKGLGVTAAEPLYVVDLRTADNTLVVGTGAETFVSGLIASELNFIAGPPPLEIERVMARIRYRGAETPALLHPRDERGYARLQFDTPQSSVTPGQSVVFYRGDEVLGGGTIKTRLRDASP